MVITIGYVYIFFSLYIGALSGSIMGSIKYGARMAVVWPIVTVYSIYRSIKGTKKCRRSSGRTI